VANDKARTWRQQGAHLATKSRLGGLRRSYFPMKTAYLRLYAFFKGAKNGYRDQNSRKS
jgi:hypothetical protein